VGAPAAALSRKESAVSFWNEDVVGAVLMVGSIPAMILYLMLRRRARTSPQER
jgi:hypothetical protein